MLAVCCAGGGSKGIIAYAYLQALQDFGIKPDLVFGSSVGSLCGAKYFQGDLEALRYLWLSIRNRDVYKSDGWDYIRALQKGYLYDSTPLANLLKRHVPVEGLRRPDRKLIISTANFSTWEPLNLSTEELTDEEIHPFLLASASPPLYFPKVSFRGQDLRDAGVCQNYNIASAILAGADTIITLNFATPDPVATKGIVEVLAATIDVATYAYYSREKSPVGKINKLVRKLKDCAHCPNPDEKEIKIIEIRPTKPVGIPLLDFEYRGIDRPTLIMDGYNHAMSILKKELE